MEEIYFTILRNYSTNRFSVIGALSAEEEMTLVQRLVDLGKRNDIKCDRVSLDMNRSLNEEIEDISTNNLNMEIVPINELFEDETFINL